MDESSRQLFLRLFEHLKEDKPNDRSELDRRYAIVLTELEKAFAYYDQYIFTGWKIPAENQE